MAETASADEPIDEGLLRAALLRGVRGGARLVYGANTLGAATAVVDNGRVLLVRDIHRPKNLSLPGGFVRRNEDPSRAAQRELLEEVGLRSEFDLVRCTLAFDYRFPHVHFLWKVDFDPTSHGMPNSRGIRRWEILSHTWCELSDLPEAVSKATRAQLAILGLIEAERPESLRHSTCSRGLSSRIWKRVKSNGK